MLEETMKSSFVVNQCASSIVRYPNSIGVSSEVWEALCEARDAFGAITLTSKAISGASLSDEAQKRVRRARIAIERALNVAIPEDGYARR
jgi:hypothetical protein